MARAKISVGGVDGTAFTVAIGSTVLLSNDGNGGELTYAWSFVDQPEGTVDALTNPAIQNPSFVPTKEGTYLVRLVVNATLGSEAIQTCAIAVLDIRTNQRLPAASESTESDAARGWATGQDRINILALRAYADPHIVTAMTPGSIAVGAIVQIFGIGTVNASTQAAADVPKIAAATGFQGSVRGRLGVVLDGVVPGVLTANKLVFVRTFGIVPGASSGDPTVGDPVYVSDAGVPSLTQGTYPRLIGRVVSHDSGAHTYRWLLDGGDGLSRIERRITTPAEMYVIGGSGWTRANETALWGWSATTGDGLVIPLHVHQGEQIERIEISMTQSEPGADVSTNIYRGGDGAATVTSAEVDSPDTSTDLIWNIAPSSGAIQLPMEVGPHQMVWLVVDHIGTGNRTIFNATTHVRPPNPGT